MKKYLKAKDYKFYKNFRIVKNLKRPLFYQLNTQKNTKKFYSTKYKTDRKQT